MLTLFIGIWIAVNAAICIGHVKKWICPSNRLQDVQFAPSFNEYMRSASGIIQMGKLIYLKKIIIHMKLRRISH